MTTESGHGVSRTVLPGGLRVVTESLPAVRSVALGIWVGVGSRDEDQAHAGATHYLEHLLFKGTRRRTALEISAEMDAAGGEMNAFTAKEYTCYYARVLDADLPLAVDILSDMVTSSLITPKDVDAERNVVLEEIAMNDDDPSDTVHEAFTSKLFGDTPLGRPILGTTDSINAITRDQIFEHYQARYTPEHLVVAAAGNLDHDTVVELVRKAFGPALERAAEPALPRLAGDQRGHPFGVGTTLISRSIEQANLVLGCEALARTDDRRFALGVLNAAFGGGMSSRLFQEVREKRGLAYSVYSFSGQHADSGMWGIYVGCLPSKADEVLAICRDEIARVVEERPDRRRADPRQGPGARLDRAQPGGPVLADEPTRQVRAGLPAAGAGRRGAQRDRRRRPRRHPRDRRRYPHPPQDPGRRRPVRRPQPVPGLNSHRGSLHPSSGV